jgi:hypothetical protein
MKTTNENKKVTEHTKELRIKTSHEWIKKELTTLMY